MSYEVLARKHRPRCFEDVVGQRHVVDSLVNALASGRLHHAYLFTGTRGVGKTTLARILVRALNCETGITPRPCGVCGVCRDIDSGRFPDLIEVDAASRTKVDETRELLDDVHYAPARGRFKVYLIDEVHMFSEKSFNALLKTLEEPPPHVKFLLATTEARKLPITVLSRCLQFTLKHLGVEPIAGHLASVLENEAIPFEPEACRLLAEAAAGSVRDALSLLDQAVVHGGGRVAAGPVAAMLGVIERGQVVRGLERLVAGDADGLLAWVAALAELQGGVDDFDGLLVELLRVLQRIAVLQLAPAQAEGELDAALAALARELSPEAVQLHYQIGLQGRRDLPVAPDPRAGFEMTLLRMLAFQPAGGEGGGPTPTKGAPDRQGMATSPRAAAGPAAPTPTPTPVALAAAPVEAPEGFDWPALATTLPVTGFTRELAFNARLARYTGDTLALALPQDQAQLASARALQGLAAALGAVLGEGLSLTVDTVEAAALPAGESAHERRRREQAARIEAARSRMAAHPFVQEFEALFAVRPEDIHLEEPARAAQPVQQQRPAGPVSSVA